MIAGEQKLLVVYPNSQDPLNPSTSPLSLAGATVTLKIRQPTGATKTWSMVIVSTDSNPVNHYAYYRTLSTDFPKAGAYILQVFGTFSDGSSLKMPQVIEEVGASL